MIDSSYPESALGADLSWHCTVLYHTASCLLPCVTNIILIQASDTREASLLQNTPH